MKRRVAFVPRHHLRDANDSPELLRTAEQEFVAAMAVEMSAVGFIRRPPSNGEVAATLGFSVQKLHLVSRRSVVGRETG